MKNLICLLRGHKPYWYETEHFVDGNGVKHYAPGLRSCGRCNEPLPGGVPQIGDRRKITA